MIDPMTGWALTDDRVLWTTDSGYRWRDVTPPGAPGANGIRFGAAFFAGRDAWIAPYPNAEHLPGPLAISHTRDGGRNWSTILLGSVPAPVMDITFSDATHGWIMLGGNAAMGSEGVAILRSTDGGQHWARIIDITLHHRTDHGLPIGGDKTGIAFRDTSTGWIPVVTPAAGTVWLYVSHDGGRSWQRVVLGLPAEFPSGAVALPEPPRFFGTRDGLLPVIVDDRTLLVYASHDGGQRWQPTTPVRFGMKSSGRIVYDFMDPEHGWASDGRMLYQTTDGTRDWTKLTPNVPLTSLTQLDFVSPTVGWAVLAPPRSVPRLLTTTDGGKSWTAIHAEVMSQ